MEIVFLNVCESVDLSLLELHKPNSPGDWSLSRSPFLFLVLSYCVILLSLTSTRGSPTVNYFKYE